MKRLILLACLVASMGCDTVTTMTTTPATAYAKPVTTPVVISYYAPSTPSITKDPEIGRSVSSMPIDMTLWWVVEGGRGRCYLYDRLPEGGTLSINLQSSVCRDQGLFNEAPAMEQVK